jgi:hypothetical protein
VFAPSMHGWQSAGTELFFGFEVLIEGCKQMYFHAK